jgi:hypothetical protein
MKSSQKTTKQNFPSQLVSALVAQALGVQKVLEAFDKELKKQV